MKSFLTQLLQLNKTDFETLKTTLKTEGIDFIKTDNRMILFNNIYSKYKYNKTNIQSYCRSLILDVSNNTIVNYTYKNILSNNDTQKCIFDMKINNIPYKLMEAMEGTILSVYYYNNQWRISTRRISDIYTNKYNNNTNTYSMFLDALQTYNLDIDLFYKSLDTNFSYTFLLVHHKNKTYLDYSKYFKNNNYATLYLMFLRDKDFNYVDPPTNIYEKINYFNNEDEYLKYYETNPNSQGLMYLVKDYDNKDITLLLSKTQQYLLFEDLFPTQNTYKNLMHMMWKNLLCEYYLNTYNYYVDNNPLFSHYEKIPTNVVFVDKLVKDDPFIHAQVINGVYYHNPNVKPTEEEITETKYNIEEFMYKVYEQFINELLEVFYYFYEPTGTSKKESNDDYILYFNDNQMKCYKTLFYKLRGFININRAVNYVYKTDKIINFTTLSNILHHDFDCNLFLNLMTNRKFKFINADKILLKYCELINK